MILGSNFDSGLLPKFQKRRLDLDDTHRRPTLGLAHAPPNKHSPHRAPIGHLSGPQWAPCGHLAGTYFLLVFFHYCFWGVASGGNSGIILVTRCTWKAAFGNAIYLDRFFVSYLLPTTNYYYITTDYLWGKQEKMVYRCLIDGWIYRLADT